MRQPLPAARSEVDPGKGSVSEERWNLLSAILVVLADIKALSSTG